MDKLDEIFKGHKERIYIVIQPWNVGSDRKIKLTGGHLLKNVPFMKLILRGDCIINPLAPKAKIWPPRIEYGP